MKESLIYLNLLYYIKSNGIKDFEKLFADLEQFHIKEENIVEDLIIFNKIDEVNNLITRNIKLLGFLRSMPCKSINFLGSEFKFFIRNIKENIDKLDLYIENAQKLVLLDIDQIDFVNLKVEHLRDISIYYDSLITPLTYVNNENQPIYFSLGNVVANRVIYTDGNTKLTGINAFTGKGTETDPFINNRIGKDENYKLNIKDASFILTSENHKNNRHFKYITISDFGFKADKLPTKQELESYSEPEYVKQYKKTFK